MCNPRRVMIHLAQCIEEAWRQTIEQAATASGEVAELARINAEVQLDEEMGDMALGMLERVLAGDFEGFEPWERDSLGHYHRELDGVMLIYNPEDYELTIEAQLTELVTAEARATAEASGFTVGGSADSAWQVYVDAAELASEGYGYVRLKMVESTNQEADGVVCAYLVNPRYVVEPESVID